MKMRTALTLALPVLALAAQALPAASQEVSSEELTRRLNGAPVRVQTQTAPAKAPVVAPQSMPSPEVNAVVRPETVAPAAAQNSTSGSQSGNAGDALTRMLNNRNSAAPAIARTGEPEVEQVRAVAPVTAVRPSPEPVPAPVVSRRQDGPSPLSAQAIAGLPFRIDLQGAEIIERPAGADGKVYSVRMGSHYLLMIYAGHQSQFPLYDGQTATVAGRYTTVVTQDGKRMAAEHLFRREEAEPHDIHIWLMSLDGEYAGLAERIGQSVDPR